MKTKKYGVFADNRDSLIVYLALHTSPDLVKADGEDVNFTLLSVTCGDCGKRYDYKWFNDLPEDSVECECGKVTIIGYRKVKKEKQK